jgi:uncharacterized membrane protein YhaH (DUF805 family)
VPGVAVLALWIAVAVGVRYLHDVRRTRRAAAPA